MKRIILLAITALITFTAAAQVKIYSGDPYIELKYKRTIVSGNTVIVDFLMTNHHRNEIEACLYNFVNLSFTDDEGNSYGNQNFKIDVGNSGKETGVFSPEIPLKVRLTLTNIDEYATAITSMIYPYYYYPLPSTNSVNRTMKIYNIPIPRN